MLLGVVACTQEPSGGTATVVRTKSGGEKYILPMSGYTVYVVKIGGCQYLYLPKGSSGLLTHKGNCLNSFHFR